jgi:hypothetical protein
MVGAGIHSVFTGLQVRFTSVNTRLMGRFVVW